jgi:chorismate mutase / prephenate dehydratase
MKTIATLGPEQSQSWQAAVHYDGNAAIRTYPHVGALLAAFDAHED